MQENTVNVDKQQLNDLLTQNETQRAEIKQLYEACLKIFAMLGLAQDGKVNIDGFSIGQLIKGVKPIALLVMECKFNKSAEKKLVEKFAFFNELIPVFEKYAKEFNQN